MNRRSFVHKTAVSAASITVLNSFSTLLHAQGETEEKLDWLFYTISGTNKDGLFDYSIGFYPSYLKTFLTIEETDEHLKNASNEKKVVSLVATFYRLNHATNLYESYRSEFQFNIENPKTIERKVTSSELSYKMIVFEATNKKLISGEGILPKNFPSKAVRMEYQNNQIEIFTEDGNSLVKLKRPQTSGSGFGCFLTTACIRSLGKPDNCYELTTLRNFRDSYMSETDDRIKMVSCITY